MTIEMEMFAEFFHKRYKSTPYAGQGRLKGGIGYQARIMCGSFTTWPLSSKAISEDISGTRNSTICGGYFFGQEKHRGMYAVPEIMAIAPMTDMADYQARQAASIPMTW
jgi:hypothetical protein